MNRFSASLGGTWGELITLNGGIKQIEWDPLSLVAPGCLVYSYIYDSQIRAML